MWRSVKHRQIYMEIVCVAVVAVVAAVVRHVGTEQATCCTAGAGEQGSPLGRVASPLPLREAGSSLPLGRRGRGGEGGRLSIAKHLNV